MKLAAGCIKSEPATVGKAAIKEARGPPVFVVNAWEKSTWAERRRVLGWSAAVFALIVGILWKSIPVLFR